MGRAYSFENTNAIFNRFSFSFLRFSFPLNSDFWLSPLPKPESVCSTPGGFEGGGGVACTHVLHAPRSQCSPTAHPFPPTVIPLSVRIMFNEITLIKLVHVYYFIN